MEHEGIYHLIEGILNHFYLVNTALVDFHLYKVTACFCIGFFTYIFLLSFDEQQKYFVDAINNSIAETIDEILESDETVETRDTLAYFIKITLITVFFACVTLHLLYLKTSEPSFIEALYLINSVTFFYIFWMFFFVFFENLDLYLKDEKNMPFVDVINDEVDKKKILN